MYNVRNCPCMQVTQQANGFDCGIHVLYNISLAAKVCFVCNAIKTSDTEKAVTSHHTDYS